MLPIAVIAHHMAGATDDLSEHIVTDIDLAPDRGDQFVPADRTLAVFYQPGQGIEDLELHIHCMSQVPQLAPGNVQVVITKLKSAGIHGLREWNLAGLGCLGLGA